MGAHIQYPNPSSRLGLAETLEGELALGNPHP
jgi:hypothetical protein